MPTLTSRRQRAPSTPSSAGEGPSRNGRNARDTTSPSPSDRAGRRPSTTPGPQLQLPDLDALAEEHEMTPEELVALLDGIEDIDELPEDFDPNNVDYKRLFPHLDLENMPIINDISEKDFEMFLDENKLKKMMQEIKALGEGLPELPEAQTEEDKIREIEKIQKEVEEEVKKSRPMTLEELERMELPKELEEGEEMPSYPWPDYALTEFRKFRDSMDPNLHKDPKLQIKFIEKIREDCARLGDVLRILRREPDEQEKELLKKNEGYVKQAIDHLAEYHAIVDAIAEAEKQARTGTYGADVTPLGVYEREMERWEKEYEKKSEFDKYANVPEFVEFKRTVWEAFYDTPVPPKRKWFSTDLEEDDDDIGISAVKINYKDPLTLKLFEKPVTNKECNHSYEKQAILDLIVQTEASIHARQRTGKINCPVPGCSAKLSKDSLFVDSVLVRGLKRYKEMEEIRKMEEELEEELDWGDLDPDCIDDEGNYHPEWSKKPKKTATDNGEGGPGGQHKDGDAKEIKKEMMSQMPKKIVLDDDEDEDDL